MASASSSSIPLASGSNMGSLPAVWAYILPALDTIMRSEPESPDAPALDVSYHMGVYTVVYNFATASKAEASQTSNGPSSSSARMLTNRFGLGGDGESDEDPSSLALSPLAQNMLTSQKDWFAERVERVKSMVGYELYVHLEDYFRGVARDIRLRAPADDAALLPYYLAAYSRYVDGLWSVHHLFAYLNRHFITRAVDEGMGWISMQDVAKDLKRPPAPPNPSTSSKKSSTKDKDAELLDVKKRELLKAWGLKAGGTPDQRRYAEQCVEAGSPSDRIIPVASLAQRCWRLEVVEPFLSAGAPKSDLSTTNGNGVDHYPSSPSPPNHIQNLSSQLDSTHLAPPSNVSPSVLDGSSSSKSAKKNKKKREKAKEKGKQKESLHPDDATTAEDDAATTTTSAPTSSIPSSPLAHPDSRNLPPTPIPPPPPDPRGRLNRVVGDLVLTPRKAPSSASARDSATKLNKSLRSCGLKPDNIVRKRLDKFLTG